MTEQTSRKRRPATGEYWHLYNLQQLSPSRFTAVVGRILNGRYGLIGSTEKRRVILPPMAHDRR